VALAALSAPGCSKKLTTFVHPTADFGLIERVAVLPLENLTTDDAAAEKVRQLLIIELLSSGAVDVVDVGEVARGIRAAGVGNAAAPGTEDAQKLGEELQVQALLAGSVQEFARGRGSGTVATNVSLVFRLLETDTGQVIWSSSISQTGTGAMARLFGVGGDSPGERARKLIRKALRKLIS
jgi:TolB-like protein